MTTLGIVLLWFVIGYLLAQVHKLWKAARFYRQHEMAHCQQIGELQHHLAVVLAVLDDRGIVLPDELRDYSAQVLDE